MDLGNFDSLSFIGPELVLVAAVLIIIALSFFQSDAERIGDIALGGIALSLVAMALVQHELKGWLFDRMLFHDPFSAYFKVFIALSSMAAIWMSVGSAEVRRMNQGQYFGLLLASSVGMYFMVAAANLLIVFLAVELASLTAYVATCFLDGDKRSKEAALKYFLYGSVASAVTLFGMSWLFGLAGSLDLVVIHAALANIDGEAPAWTFAVAMVLIGIGCKMAIVPLHMWAPDVYGGAPMPVAAFISVGALASGSGLLIRLVLPVLSRPIEHGMWQPLGEIDWPYWFMVLAVASMTLGNLAALRQVRLKRMLAYSGIAHSGYLLMGVAVAGNKGVEASMFYLGAYFLMNIGAFTVLLLVHDQHGDDHVDSVRGLAWRGGIFPAIALTIFLFSLIGLPPFVGMFAKFYVIAAVVEQEMYVVAVIAAANMLLAASYCLPLVYAMFVDVADEKAPRVEFRMHEGMMLALLVAGTCAFGIWSAPLYAFARYSLEFFPG